MYVNIYGLCDCLSFQVEFPPLAAYRLEFGEPELDPEEVEKGFSLLRKRVVLGGWGSEVLK